MQNIIAHSVCWLLSALALKTWGKQRAISFIGPRFVQSDGWQDSACKRRWKGPRQRKPRVWRSSCWVWTVCSRPVACDRRDGLRHFGAHRYLERSTQILMIISTFMRICRPQPIQFVDLFKINKSRSCVADAHWKSGLLLYQKIGVMVLKTLVGLLCYESSRVFRLLLVVFQIIWRIWARDPPSKALNERRAAPSYSTFLW